MLEIAVTGIAYLIQSNVLQRVLPETMRPVVQNIKKFFCGDANDLHEAMKESFSESLRFVGTGLYPNLLASATQIFYSDQYKIFKQHFEEEFLQPFLLEQQFDEAQKKQFCQVGAHQCQELIKLKNKFFSPFSYEQLPELLFPSQNIEENQISSENAQTKKNFYTALKQHTTHPMISSFFHYRDLLYHCMMHFFQEKIKENKRLQAIIQIYQQHQIQFDQKNFQLKFEQTQQVLLQQQQSLRIQIQKMMEEQRTVSSFNDQLRLQRQISSLQSQQLQILADLDGMEERFSLVLQDTSNIKQQFSIFEHKFVNLEQMLQQQWQTIQHQLDRQFQEVHNHLDEIQFNIESLKTELPEKLSLTLERLLQTPSPKHERPLSEILKEMLKLASKDGTIEHKERQFVLKMAQHWGISEHAVDLLIKTISEEEKIFHHETTSTPHNQENDATSEHSYSVNKQKLEMIFLQLLTKQGNILTEMGQRRFFVEAALLQCPAEHSNTFLHLFLKQHHVQLESEIKERLRGFLSPALHERYLSANEAENLICSAQEYGFDREQALTFIDEECLKHNCVHALQLIEKFEKFIEPQLQSTTLSDIQAQRMIQWAVSKGLREIEARHFLRKQCKLRRISISL